MRGWNKSADRLPNDPKLVVCLECTGCTGYCSYRMFLGSYNSSSKRWCEEDRYGNMCPVRGEIAQWIPLQHLFPEIFKVGGLAYGYEDTRGDY